MPYKDVTRSSPPCRRANLKFPSILLFNTVEHELDKQLRSSAKTTYPSTVPFPGGSHDAKTDVCVTSVTITLVGGWGSCKEIDSLFVCLIIFLHFQHN